MNKLGTLPAVPDVERMLLGVAMVDVAAMPELRGVIEADDFSTEQHRRIWASACTVFDAGMAVDRISIAHELDRQGWLESVDGLSYLVSLDEGMPLVPHIQNFIQSLKDKAFFRRVITGCDYLMRRCELQSDTPSDIALAAQKVLGDMASPAAKSKGFVTPADIIAEHGVDHLLHPRREGTAVPLPWPWLDSWLGGLRHEQLIIVGGRTSQGKTSAVLQVATYAAKRGTKVALFSLEMSKESVVTRMICQEARIDSTRVRNNAISAAERKLLLEATGVIHDLPLYIQETAAKNTAIIAAELRKFQLKYGKPGMVIVDHLHALSAAAKRENRTQQIGDDARTLKLMAKEFGCPFLVPAQLNRGGSKENEKPALADLRQSGEIEENADVVWFVWIDLKDEAIFQRAQFMIAKQREGARDMEHPMLFAKSHQCFEEATTNVEY